MIANIIIGGTEKAGTTALYMHLARHPQICASSVKETDFFRSAPPRDADRALRAYLDCFPVPLSAQHVLLEASPGYLGESEETAARIAALLPDSHLVFILREPADRLYSLYNQHRANQNIPRQVSFFDFVQACVGYERQEPTPLTSRLSEWHLRSLQAGCYAERLRPFLDLFRPEQISLFDYEVFRREPVRVVSTICRRVSLDPNPLINLQVEEVNQTISARSLWLHRFAYRVNTALEPHLRHRPWVKQRITFLYRLLNKRRDAVPPMDDASRRLLRNYYATANAQLRSLLQPTTDFAWTADLP